MRVMKALAEAVAFRRNPTHGGNVAKRWRKRVPTEEFTIAEKLRLGLHRLGKAVVVITAWHDNRRWAMTATAVSELSMDPPSLLVCVNKTASLWEPLQAKTNFAVNILHADQQAISNACAGATKGEARFAEGDWHAADCGTPILKGAQASFLCKYATHIEYGTHAVVIGEVIDAVVEGDVDPLIYLDRGYTRVAKAG